MRFGLISRVKYILEGLRLTVYLLLLISGTSHAASFSWSDRSLGLRDLDFISISTAAKPDVAMYAATPRHAYMSRDGAQTWTLVFTLDVPSRGAIVDENPRSTPEEQFSRRDYDEDDLRRRGIVLDDENFDDIDDAELFRRLKDENLIEDPEDTIRNPASETTFPNPDNRDREMERIVAVAANPDYSDRVLILTSQAIHLSRNGGQFWTKLAINRTDIHAVAFDTNRDAILFATSDGLYQSDYSGGGFRQTSFSIAAPYTLVKRSAARSNNLIAISDRMIQLVIPDGSVTRIELPTEFISIPLLDADWIDDHSLVAVSERNIAIYTDSADWQLNPVLSLRGATLRDLVEWNDRLLLASDRGVFGVGLGLTETSTFNEGLLDLDVRAVESIRIGERSIAIAATGSGIFLGGEGLEKRELAGGVVTDTVSGLPSLEEVISAANRYHEQRPEYISSLMTGVKSQVWLPEVTVSIDGGDSDSTDYSRARSISTSGSIITIGPDDESYGTDSRHRINSELKLSWFPGNMKIARDGMACQRARKTLMQKQYKLMHRVTRLYVSLTEKLLEGNRPVSSRADALLEIQRRIEVERLLAELDGLTGMFVSTSFRNERETKFSEGD